MSASGLICGIVCIEYKDKPCPYKSWVEKNTCPKIIAFNDKLGHCCATCMNCVAEKYCTEKAGRKKRNSNTDYSQFLNGENIFEYTCDKWTNTCEEEE